MTILLSLIIKENKMKFTKEDIDKFNKALLLKEETKIIDLSDKQHDKTMNSHSTCFELSDVVELMSSVTIEKIKCELKSK